MAKSQDAKKTTKKEPLKTPKEKKEEKREKKLKKGWSKPENNFSGQHFPYSHRTSPIAHRIERALTAFKKKEKPWALLDKSGIRGASSFYSTQTFFI